ncbi:hypothetical protein [Tsuneonella litorea]|nr:hypothetical protein [Tsuneonella litorea]
MILVAFPGTPLLAQPQSVELKGDVKVVRVVGEGDEKHEELQEPTRVVPGDRLAFSTRYINSGAEPAEDFVVTNPLPSAVMLAEDGSFDVSVDGGKTYGHLASLEVANGDSGSRPATLADVTHVRWTLARIAPGAQGSLTYFAVVR